MRTSSDPLRAAETDFLIRHRPRPRLQRAAAIVSTLTRGGALWIGCSVLLGSSANKRNRATAVDGLIAWLTSETIAFAIKRVLRRPRPPLKGSGPTPSSTSMPSSHTAGAVAYTIAAGARWPAVALPLGAMATAVAWSRLAAQRHFPSDVVIGTIVGTAVGGTIAKLRSPSRLARRDPASFSSTSSMRSIAS